MPLETTRPTSISLTTPSASYEITIGAGLLGSLEKRLTKLTGGKLPRIFIVTSPEIWGPLVAAGAFLVQAIAGGAVLTQRRAPQAARER